MTIQNGLPPYLTRCLTCGAEWTPPPAKSGPDKGKVTDHTIQKSSDNHRCEETP